MQRLGRIFHTQKKNNLEIIFEYFFFSLTAIILIKNPEHILFLITTTHKTVPVLETLIYPRSPLRGLVRQL